MDGFMVILWFFHYPFFPVRFLAQAVRFLLACDDGRIVVGGDRCKKCHFMALINRSKLN